MKLRYKITSAVVAAVLIVTAVSAVAIGGYSGPKKNETLYQKAIDDHGFIYGLNYAWVGEQRRSLGDNQINNTKNSFDEKSVRTGLYNISKLGIDCTTIWLFMGGDGLEFDSTGDVTGVQPLFLKNLETVLKIATEYGVALNFTVQPHFDYNIESGLYSGSKKAYDKYTRMVTDPTVREHYIDKAVTPVLKLINKYRKIIFSITAYCEPEADIYGETNFYKPWGTTKEVMTDFIGEIVKASRRELSGIPVWVTSGWNHDETLQCFNKLGLDFIGRDIYQDYSDVPSVSDAVITTPVVLGEFGPSEASAKSTNNSFHMRNYKNFIKNAMEAGYTGAFYWMYNGKGSMQSLLGTSDTTYMPLLSTMYYTVKDNKNAAKGIEQKLDAPIMLAADIDGTLNFIASRNAEKYIVQRSADGKGWSVLTELDAGSVDESGNLIGTFYDESAEAESTYYYRIIAVDFEGGKAVSDVSQPVKFGKVICDESENMVADFSFENLKSREELGIIDDTGVWDVVTGDEGEVTHSGKTAVKCNGDGSSTWSWFYKTVNVQPNTTYTYTVFAKSESGTIQYKVLDAGKPHPENRIVQKTTSAVHLDEWVRYTTVFNSGTATAVRLAFADGGGVITVDDMYLFPTAE